MQGLSALHHKLEALRKEFRRSHETLEQIVLHLIEGVLFISKEGIITLFNPAAEKMLGMARGEVLGLPFESCFKDRLLGFSMQEALAREEGGKLACLALTTKERPLDVEVFSSWIPEKGIICFLRDVTKLRQLEAMVARSERLKELGTMAAALAHEIRNPLGGIQGFASLLYQDLKDDPKRREMLTAILEGTQTLSRLVTSVLHYARPIELHVATTDLQTTVEEACRLLGPTPQRSLRVEAPLKPLWVLIDAPLVKLALLNLVQNGLQVTPEGGELLLQIHAENRWGCVKISDQGPGIPPAHREKIFTPFFTTKAEGTGLGLSEADRIVQAHGGTITVESSHAGSIFTLKVPQVYAS